MSASPLDENLAALAGSGVVIDAPDRRPAYEGTGDARRLVTLDGRRVRLHSARDPRREAQQQLDGAIGAGAAAVVAVIAAGDGYVLELLAAQPDTRVLVIEPFPDGARGWLARRSWAPLIENGRLSVVVGPAYLATPHAARLLEAADRVPVVVNPVVLREYPDALVIARRALDRLIADARANAAARRRFEDTAWANTLANLPAIVGEADVSALAGVGAGLPAFVLGAGPSLNRNLDALADRPVPGLVICADTALQPCLAAGIEPHLVVAVDPSEVNARHLSGRRPAPATALVCEAGLSPPALGAFSGKTFFFRAGDHAPWPWLARHGVGVGRLQVWGSVVTAAVDLARSAGCAPIVFAGLDLAWTGEAPYCRHTAYESDWGWEVLAGRSLREIWDTALAYRQAVNETGIDGAPMLSTLDLVSFRDWLRGYAAAHPEVAFINGTGSGILWGPGLTQAPLAEIVAGLGPLTVWPADAVRERHRRSAGRPRIERVVSRALRAAEASALLEGHSTPDSWDDAARTRARDAAARALEMPRELPSARARRIAGIVPRPPLPIPEQIEQARRWLGRPIAASRQSPGEDRRRAHGWLAAALDHLVELSAIDAPIAGRAEELQGEPHALALLGPWRPEARASAGAFADCLAAALAAADGLATPGEPSPAERTSGVAEAASQTPLHREPPHLESRRAVIALGWEWLGYAAAVAGDADVEPLPAGVRTEARPGVNAVTRIRGLAVGPFPSVGSEGDWPAPGGAPPVALGFLIDAARGFVARATGTAIPADAPLVFTLARELLTPVPLARRHHVARLDATRALLTRDDGTGSDVMDASGELGPPSLWPGPVSHEIAFDGGRAAWDRRQGPRLYVRQAREDTAAVLPLPFLPFDLCALGDALYLAGHSGLWSWSPARGLRHLDDEGPVIAVHRHERGVRACRWPADGADGRRAPVTDVCDWLPDRDVLQRGVVWPGHAVYDVSDQGAWRAEAWFDLDLIRIVHASGRWWWIPAPGPRKLAWAGPTLLATLFPDVDLVRFPDLLVHLAALV